MQLLTISQCYYILQRLPTAAISQVCTNHPHHDWVVTLRFEERTPTDYPVSLLPTSTTHHASLKADTTSGNRFSMSTRLLHAWTLSRYTTKYETLIKAILHPPTLRCHPYSVCKRRLLHRCLPSIPPPCDVLCVCLCLCTRASELAPWPGCDVLGVGRWHFLGCGVIACHADR